MQFQDIANVSGGKDSDCVAALCADRQQRTGKAARFIMADTGHEHDWTYEHVSRLERVLGITVEWVRRDFTATIMRRRERLPLQWREAGVPEHLIDEALRILWPTGNPYLDMVLANGMFAATKRKFCTEYLKVIPADEQVVKPLLASGVSVAQWLGIRADESRNRADEQRHPRFGRGGNHKMPSRLLLYRPILDWSVDDVIAFHKSRGIPLNPLYAEGFTRVGCFPCINARKSEIARIATRFPEAIEKLRQWEAICGKASVAWRKRENFGLIPTFFPSGTVGHHVVELENPEVDEVSDELVTHKRLPIQNPIDEVVRWATTDKGQSRQANMFSGWAPADLGGNAPLARAAEQDRIRDQGHYACTAGMGYCE